MEMTPSAAPRLRVQKTSCGDIIDDPPPALEEARRFLPFAPRIAPLTALETISDVPKVHKVMSL